MDLNHIVCLPNVATNYPVSLNGIRLSDVLQSACTTREMVEVNQALEGGAHLWLLCQSQQPSWVILFSLTCLCCSWDEAFTSAWRATVPACKVVLAGA